MLLFRWQRHKIYVITFSLLLFKALFLLENMLQTFLKTTLCASSFSFAPVCTCRSFFLKYIFLLQRVNDFERCLKRNQSNVNSQRGDKNWLKANRFIFSHWEFEVFRHQDKNLLGNACRSTYFVSFLLKVIHCHCMLIICENFSKEISISEVKSDWEPNCQGLGRWRLQFFKMKSWDCESYANWGVAANNEKSS